MQSCAVRADRGQPSGLLSGAKHAQQLLSWHRFAEQKALSQLASFRRQEVCLLGRFHAFRHHLLVQAARDRQDGLDESALKWSVVAEWMNDLSILSVSMGKRAR